jgi:hypothetical protein
MLSEDWFVIEDVVKPTEEPKASPKKETVFDRASKDFDTKVNHLLDALFGDEEGVEVHVIRVHN